MKHANKYKLIALLVTAVLCLLCAALVSLSLTRIKEASNSAVARITAAAIEGNPDLDGEEIIRALNSADAEKAKKLLETYGITDELWAVSENSSESALAVWLAAGSCALCGLLCTAVLGAYSKSRSKNSKKLAEYLARINGGEYDLAASDNSESEDSLLKNEIYKTTVTLRESAQSSDKGRQSLKRSLSDISHQLKTPLTSVMIMTENLLDNPEMPAPLRQEFLRDIRYSGESISFLVQSLLTLSKLDADSVELKSRGERLGDIFDGAIKNTAVLAELKAVEVTQRGGDVVLKCDKKWLTEAISNIVKNCVEHTGEGGCVELCAAQNRLYTKITVTDNGSGIDKEDLPHIFERFYKGKNADENSVGIGLALSKAIIEKAGGRISVDSKPGEGSRFTIKFFDRIESGGNP